MKVSVRMLTYNIEKFVAQALESVLMQKVDFDYEIVIGEDCSTDNTRNIVMDYHNKYPDKIRLLLNDANVGVIHNDIQVFSVCKGKYIALLDGDDYWSSPHKLQKQVEYLDNHPECSACFHLVTDFYEDGSQAPLITPPHFYRKVLCLKDFLECPITPTSSVMFRKGILDKSFLSMYSTSLMGPGDWVFILLAAQRGHIGYLDEVMGAYRIHSGGLISGAGFVEILKDRIEMFKKLDAYLNFEYHRTYKELISHCHYVFAREYANIDRLSDARTQFIKSVLECPFNQRISYKDFIKISLRLYVPPLFELMGLDLLHEPHP